MLDLMKLFEGGFVPHVIAGVMLIVMRAWMRGTNTLEDSAAL